MGSQERTEVRGMPVISASDLQELFHQQVADNTEAIAELQATQLSEASVERIVLRMLQERGLTITRTHVRHEFPSELARLSSLSAQFGTCDSAVDDMRIVLGLRKTYIPAAQKAARASGLRHHAKILALLQVAAAWVKPEAISEKERRALVTCLELAAAPQTGNAAAIQAGLAVRAANLDITQVPMPD